jgi:hypothetical protein
MIETPHQILESSFRIAWDYLQRTGELGEPEAATRFLLDNIVTSMKQGERRKLLLSNRAIDAYKRWQAAQDFALVS